MDRSSALVAARVPVHLLIALALVIPLYAGPAYESSKHGHPLDGVARDPALAPGACGQCHQSHATHDGLPNAGPFDKTLFDVNDETLCYSCHAASSSHAVYPGSVLWADSSHFLSTQFYWRGPDPKARTAHDAGKCINCHDPHATEDGDGIVPSQLHLREELLCLGCHNGFPAKDVRGQLQRTWRHPVDLTGRHDPSEAIDPLLDPQRHAECADCHNPHTARTDAFGTFAPEASFRLSNVSRVGVVNGAAGTKPLYQWRAADDTTQAKEYEVCFKCHSSWKPLPLGVADLSIPTNPSNASYHPIQARGRNLNIAFDAFEDGWSWDSYVLCSDCHGSDDPLVRGPHGSSYEHILKGRSTTSSALSSMLPTDLCFSCHRWEVYGDAMSDATTQRASRFNDPSGRGHVYHVGTQRIPCYACHETHGSVTQPALIATSRMPGILTYSQNAAGGSCTPTCHVTRNYGVNYPR